MARESKPRESERSVFVMQCYECKWPTLQKTRGGEKVCPRCGARAPSGGEGNGKNGEQPSRVVKLYTGILVVWALIVPFLTPIIIEISLANP